MITELRIADLGVIKEATLAPAAGFTVVTGETGAGKTMIVTSLELLLGARSEARMVRSGAERARVECRLESADAELASEVEAAGGGFDDGELLMSRHVTAAGRSRAYVGGSQVPVNVCASFAERLVAVHGQSEQVRLAELDRQRELLDDFAGEQFADLAARYRDTFAQRRSAVAELADLRGAAQARAREIDLLRFGLDEIAAVAPEAAEDVTLAAEARRLESADDLRQAALGALAQLAGVDDSAGGALSALAQARRTLERAGEDTLARLGGRVGEATYLITDVASELAHYLDDLDADPGRLEWLAARRAALSSLCRKYGEDIDAVIAWSGQATERLVDLSASDDRIDALTHRIEQLDPVLEDLAGQLSTLRAAAAAAFSTAAAPELAALAMPQARLTFQLTRVAAGPHGQDRVELLFAANLGTEPRSLGKVASGGELSRVRLALEVVLARGRTGTTLVFDEVDAGIGGRVAVEVGRRLAQLARTRQVLAVTHLAQVAAFAERHYVVVKSDDGAVTTSGLQLLDDSDRAAELARMMAGLETSETSLAHADELLQLASGVRKP